MCKRKHGLSTFVINLFSIVAPLYYGQRKKRTDRTKRTEDKSIRRCKRKRGADDTFLCAKKRNKKIFVPEQAFEFMKNMNPQQLVDFFAKRRRLARQNIEWKCFWRLINILHANSGLFTCEEEKIFHA